MATLKNTTIDDTGFLQIPSGTTAQRPASPVIGDFRYNTEEETFEVYDGEDWVEIGTTSGLYAFTTATFSPGGATGRLGPSLTQARNGLSGPEANDWRNNTELFNTTNGIQLWTVPRDGTYRIETWGAQGGGGARGGLGARMRGDFTLTQGDIIKILVGHQGLTGPNQRSAGGGGVSAVWKPNPLTLLVAAGGGGGVTAGNLSSPPGLSNGQTTENGAAGQSSPTWNNYPGGTAGNGGGASRGAGGGGSGGGWLSNAENDTGSSGGFGRPNGWLGGNLRSSGSDRISGSFGGSGGASDGGTPNSFSGGGGGGGYSGGGAGVGDGGGSSGAGGGGGSFNSGTNPSNSAAVRVGDGQVTITLL